MTPCRIQRKRIKGWKMPENTVYVGRGSKWGNPYVVGGKNRNIFVPVPDDARMAVKWFDETLNAVMGKYGRGALAPLRGKNLACWCGLCDRHKDGKPLGEDCPDCQPCHADVLLQMANKEGAEQ